MTVNQKIIQALTDLGMPVKPDEYTGTDERYITFNYADDRAILHCDDEPCAVVAYMQVHLFLPKGEPYLELRKQIRTRLFSAGFTYPEITELNENDAKHIVFECEIEEESEV